VSPEDPPKRRRGRPALPPEQQRRRLLDAAERAFERNHYERTSVQDVVREAGMSSRSFYEVFESKADLAAELARDRAENFVSRIADVLLAASGPVEGIDELLRIYLETLPVVVIDLEHLGGEAGDRVRAIRDEYRNRIQLVLMGAFSQIREQGLIENEPDPLAVELVIAGIESLSIRFHHAGAREELVALHPELLRAIRGLFPDHLGESATAQT
jgi:AcrR family transcriptional regulator